MSKKGMKRRVLPMLIGVAVGAVVGVALAKSGFRADRPVGEVFLCLLAALFFQIVIHEAGHLVAGRLAGYRLYSFRVMGLVLEQVNGRYKFMYRKASGYGGLCIMFPPERGSKGQHVLFYSGGLAANILCSLGCYLLVSMVVQEPSLLRTLLLTNILMGTLMGIGNAIPFVNAKNFKTDGKLIWDILRNAPGYEYAQKLQYLGARIMGGVRPAALDEIDTAETSLIPDTSWRARWRMMAYYQQLDRGEYDNAVSTIIPSDEDLAGLSPIQAQSNKAELLFTYSILQPNKERADALYQELRGHLERDKTVGSYRIQAAYHAMLCDTEAARVLLQKAHSVAGRYNFPGLIPYEQSLLALVEGRLEAVAEKVAVAAAL